ncbi:transketolase-like TK C-terminal-containing protein, partial [Mycoplasmopsis synoviae]|uniref:transketolase-like TK C-terminal-containing protein n=1 Tax=Mycoplasmopsis synoviae TaxID=2109 RepID=UPI00387B3260
ALEVAEELKKHSIKAQVVSVMLLDELVNNENLALSLGLNKEPMYALEASSDSYWYKLSKFNKLDGQFANEYGYSEDGDKVYKLKGIEAQSIAKKVLTFLKK